MDILVGIRDFTTTILVLIIVLIIYFIPTTVATGRNDKHECGIFLLNLLLGWTVLGWIGALIWAVSDNQKRRYDGKINLDR